MRLRGLVGAIETYWHARVKNSIVNSACTFEEALYFFFRQSAWSSLGPFNYFFYRRSDPTFVAGLALMSVVGRDGLLLDLCCGVGHFTRTLAQHRDHTTVIGFDEFFFLLYLGKRFLAPHVTFICGSANLPLPFRQREFTYAFCSDAFFDIEGQWGCARELLRTVDERGVIMLVHLHNPLWPHSYRGSHPLPARAYRNLFESRAPKFFSERTLLDDYIAERPLDLAQEPTDKELASVPAFSMIATLREGVFVRHSTFAEPYEAKALEINPLYHACREADRFLLTLEVPQEYRRDYPELEVVLPPRVEFDIALLEAARNGVSSPEVRRLLQRRILVPLPPRYLRAGTANRC
ncbi:MAG: class I SAM-dependent methyltransferase [Desulfomonile tiedjei]|nr:class I SAM-dependent methyltransferase [Desulfomonile tiedjei]